MKKLVTVLALVAVAVGSIGSAEAQRYAKAKIKKANKSKKADARSWHYKTPNHNGQWVKGQKRPYQRLLLRPSSVVLKEKGTRTVRGQIYASDGTFHLKLKSGKSFALATSSKAQLDVLDPGLIGPAKNWASVKITGTPGAIKNKNSPKAEPIPTFFVTSVKLE